MRLDQNQSRHRVWHIRSVPAGTSASSGMTSLSLAAVSSDNPVSGDEHIRLARASGRFGIGRVAQPKRIQRRSSTPRAATDLGNPATDHVRSENQLCWSFRFAGDIHLVRYDFDRVDSGKIRFAERAGHSDQNRHTVCLQRHGVGRREGSRETASNAALRQNAFIMGVELIHTLNIIY